MAGGAGLGERLGPGVAPAAQAAAVVVGGEGRASCRSAARRWAARPPRARSRSRPGRGPVMPKQLACGPHLTRHACRQSPMPMARCGSSAGDRLRPRPASTGPARRPGAGANARRQSEDQSGGAEPRLSLPRRPGGRRSASDPAARASDPKASHSALDFQQFELGNDRTDAGDLSAARRRAVHERPAVRAAFDRVGRAC